MDTQIFKMRFFKPKIKSSITEDNAKIPLQDSVKGKDLLKSAAKPAEKMLKELELGKKMSIIRMIDALIECAQELRSSDIHLDPENQLVRVRFRIDGVLQDVYQIPKAVHDEVISRIKILAGLRTDEHRSAQDGRFRVTMEKATG